MLSSIPAISVFYITIKCFFLHYTHATTYVNAASTDIIICMYTYTNAYIVGACLTYWSMINQNKQRVSKKLLNCLHESHFTIHIFLRDNNFTKVIYMHNQCCTPMKFLSPVNCPPIIGNNWLCSMVDMICQG